MHIPDIAPIGGSLGWSSLVAALPLVTVFVTLGVLKWKAHWAGLSALAVAAVVAVAAYGMPVQLAALSATQFHPEKSGDAGAQLLTNWLATLD